MLKIVMEVFKQKIINLEHSDPETAQQPECQVPPDRFGKTKMIPGIGDPMHEVYT